MASILDRAESETAGMALPERTGYIKRALTSFADANGIRL
jgi:hypothetical protein